MDKIDAANGRRIEKLVPLSTPTLRRTINDQSLRGDMSLRKKSFHRSFVGFCALTVVLLICAGTTPVAQAQIYTNLFNFDDEHGADPQNPQLLAQGRDGNLYGTAPNGNKGGTVFRFTPDGTPKVLSYFDGINGARSYSGLTLGTDGDFYGTTFIGGSNRDGTIFRITPAGSLKRLYDFTSGQTSPTAPPIEAADGDFYGTSGESAYRLTRGGAFAFLATLPGGSTSPLLQAMNGNFYGTTNSGGTSNNGTVFTMTAQGIVTVIFNFDNHVPAFDGPLIQGTDGNFYGTTYGGGDNKSGIVFKLTPKGVVTALHSFPDPTYPDDGAHPYAGLLQASDGNFYGVTFNGGTMGYGIIFEITAAGDYSILYNFDPATGSNPASTPMQHTNGTMYGLTEAGGLGDGAAYSFSLGLPPFVRLQPTLGKAGTVIEFLGQGFTGTTERSRRSRLSRIPI
jgi:uncharacterized repeat protein (TIGR03803 family)